MSNITISDDDFLNIFYNINSTNDVQNVDQNIKNDKTSDVADDSVSEQQINDKHQIDPDEVIKTIEEFIDITDRVEIQQDDDEFMKRLYDNTNETNDDNISDNETTDDKTDDNISDKSNETTDDKSNETTDDNISDKSNETTDDKSNETTDDKSNVNISDKSNETTDDKSNETTDDKSNVNISDKSNDNISDKSNDNISDKSNDNISDKSTNKNKKLKIPIPSKKDIEVAVSSEPEKVLDDETVNNMKDKYLTNISKQLEIIEQKLEPIDSSEYDNEKTQKYKNFLLNHIIVPTSAQNHLLSASLIRGLTSYSEYNPFNTIDTTMAHDIPSRIIALKNLNKIFKYNFIDENKYNRNYRLDDIDKLLSEFFMSRANVPTLRIEYKIITTFLNKLMIALHSIEELAFRNSSSPMMNITFKLAVSKELDFMSRIQNSREKTARSWFEFTKNLLDINPTTCKIYKFKNHRELNIQLKQAYSADFKSEELIGNMLKTYLPSITYNYLFAIKAVYILARMITIYIHSEAFKNKSSADIASDLKYISTIAITTYENKYHIIAQVPRSFPTYTRELSSQTIQYINTHIFTGPQYYLLKYLEKSVMALVQDLHMCLR